MNFYNSRDLNPLLSPVDFYEMEEWIDCNKSTE